MTIDLEELLREIVRNSEPTVPLKWVKALFKETVEELTGQIKDMAASNREKYNEIEKLKKQLQEYKQIVKDLVERSN